VIHTSCDGKMIHAFLLVFFCIFATFVHRFVYIEVLLLTGNDVIAKSPPGGARNWQNEFILEEGI
jgi:hypothetical protein